MGLRHDTRRLALQALYGLDANPEQGGETAIAAALAELGGEAEADRGLMESYVLGAWSKRGEIDQQIEKVSKNWKLSRMDRVDRSILRLAVFELTEKPDVPAPVILSEAIELAKEFGAPDSSAFVNGILDRIARHFRKEEVKER